MLLTRSPVYSASESDFLLDLHVLGTPPAFVLSQDQTLRCPFISLYALLLLLLLLALVSIPSYPIRLSLIAVKSILSLDHRASRASFKLKK